MAASQAVGAPGGAGRCQKYRALSELDWQTVIGATTDSWKKYKSDFFDCDDFAVCQKAEISLHYDINGCGQVFDTSGEPLLQRDSGL